MGEQVTLVGLVFEPLGRVVGWGAYVWLTWTICVVEWTARFPYASVPLKLPFWGLVAVYAVIAALTGLAMFSLERRRAALQSLRERLLLKLALGWVALATVVSWFAILQFPDGVLHVVFLDVGQGDAIFIETPGGVQILVDGGPEGSVLLSELGCQMPVWDHSPDLVLTHPDADHLVGQLAGRERTQPPCRSRCTSRLQHKGLPCFSPTADTRLWNPSRLRAATADWPKPGSRLTIIPVNAMINAERCSAASCSQRGSPLVEDAWLAVAAA